VCPQNASTCVWNHPLDLHFYTSSLAGWPQLVLEVGSLDFYGGKHLSQTTVTGHGGHQWVTMIRRHPDSHQSICMRMLSRRRWCVRCSGVRVLLSPEQQRHSRHRSRYLEAGRRSVGGGDGFSSRWRSLTRRHGGDSSSQQGQGPHHTTTDDTATAAHDRHRGWTIMCERANHHRASASLTHLCSMVRSIWCVSRVRWFFLCVSGGSLSLVHAVDGHSADTSRSDTTKLSPAQDQGIKKRSTRDDMLPPCTRASAIAALRCAA
jgi:hypothetical protein